MLTSILVARRGILTSEETNKGILYTIWMANVYVYEIPWSGVTFNKTQVSKSFINNPHWCTVSDDPRHLCLLFCLHRTRRKFLRYGQSNGNFGREPVAKGSGFDCCLSGQASRGTRLPCPGTEVGTVPLHPLPVSHKRTLTTRGSTGQGDPRVSRKDRKIYRNVCRVVNRDLVCDPSVSCVRSTPLCDLLRWVFKCVCFNIKY